MKTVSLIQLLKYATDALMIFTFLKENVYKFLQKLLIVKNILAMEFASNARLSILMRKMDLSVIKNRNILSAWAIHKWTVKCVKQILLWKETTTYSIANS